MGTWPVVRKRRNHIAIFVARAAESESPANCGNLVNRLTQMGVASFPDNRLRWLSMMNTPSHMSMSDLRNVKAARQRADQAERSFHEAILRAHRAGETYRDIGEWAGLSHQRCQEIVKKLLAEQENE